MIKIRPVKVLGSGNGKTAVVGNLASGEQRLKQSGMHWTVSGDNNIIALRCSLLSHSWEDFWEHRAAA